MFRSSNVLNPVATPGTAHFRVQACYTGDAMNTSVLSRRAAILFAVIAPLAGCQDRNRPPSVTTADSVRPLVIAGSIVESGVHTPISGASICWGARCSMSGDDGGYR